MFPENCIRQIFIRIMISTPHSLMIIYREVLDHFYSILWAGNCSYSLVHIFGINKVTNNFWHKRALGLKKYMVYAARSFFSFTPWTIHCGLKLNMNVCLFLHTFNAISESEYVKLASMCYFFLISMICFRDIKILSYLSPYFNLY